MKTLFFSLFLVVASQVTAAAGTAKDTLVVKTKISCDHCLQCGSCGPNIKKSIRKNEGVKSVSIDPKLNTITVIYDSGKITPDKIREAILQSGFDADDKAAPAEAVNKLDGCCRKQ